MNKTSIAVSHQNNFNLIRMVAASLVLISHSYALCGFDEPLKARLGVTWGSIAVDIFFATSGYLVTASIIRGANAKNFVFNRVLRIFPGLIVAVLFTTIVCSIWFTTFPFLEFWSQWKTWRYLIKNMMLVWPQGLEWSLPQTLIGIPSDKGGGAALNGSLWTLPQELKMYTYLLAIYIGCSGLNRLFPLSKWGMSVFFIFTIYVVAAIALLADVYFTINGHHKLVLHMGAMFFAGSAAFVRKISFSRLWPFSLAAICVVVATAVISGHAFLPIYTLILPWSVLAIAYAPTSALHRYNQLGDFSYGMYIYAFPVQQWVAYLIKDIQPLQMMLICFPVVLALSMLSWKLVERRALAFKARRT
jgi:peptidoglycan/LPS O-acetylase OafA/YrhL